MEANHHREVAHSGLQVLVVEDEAVARFALQSLLSGYGFSTRAVASGEEALRVAEGEADALVALIDLDLPGMDGAELLKRLKMMKPDLKAIIITAASRDRVRKVIDSDVPHLRKPLDFPRLLRFLCDGPPA